MSTEKRLPNLIVTENGVPCEDQADGLRRFTEAQETQLSLDEAMRRLKAAKISRYDHGGARVYYEDEQGNRDLIMDIYGEGHYRDLILGLIGGVFPETCAILADELRTLHAEIVACDGHESEMMALIRRAAEALGQRAPETPATHWRCPSCSKVWPCRCDCEAAQKASARQIVQVPTEDGPVHVEKCTRCGAIEPDENGLGHAAGCPESEASRREFAFDRYRGGRLMAEGIVVHAADINEAIQKAHELRPDNRDTLVLRPAESEKESR